VVSTPSAASTGIVTKASNSAAIKRFIVGFPHRGESVKVNGKPIASK
jgi:hypothetical protein